MGRNRRTDREIKNSVDVIKENSKIIAENSRTIVENTGRANEKLDDMGSDIDAIKGSSQKIAENAESINEKLDDVRNSTKSKLPIIIAIIGVIVAIIGVFASISGISIVDIIADKKTADVTSESVSEVEPEPEYKIYLYPEYSKFSIYSEVDMTASLNFETDAVNITAHLASGKEESVSLEQKNSEEWQKKVIFDEVGVHEVVVAATAPNGEVIENSIEVEVTPVSFDMDIDMDAINQLFSP